jgi:GxxExxY protein
MNENELSKIILNIAFLIHSQYGPGLFESVYEELMFYELNKLGLKVKRQIPIPLVHESIKLEAGFRADLIAEDKVLIEIKSIECLAPIHYKQVTTYLKLSNIRLGLLINFNVALIKDGIQRIVNNLKL